MIKSQDVLVLLKLVSIGSKSWSYRDLSYELGLSASQLHAAVKRLMEAKLVTRVKAFDRPHIRNAEEFLVHAVKYLFVTEKGEITRGIPTAYSAPPLNSLLTVSPDEPPLVWPDPEGKLKGTSFAPIHKVAPLAAKKDHKLYEMLVLIDSIRGGRVREQEIAKKKLIKRLQEYQ
jgi:hypothetical protein